MKYNFDEIIDRRCSQSVKWDHFDEGVIPMWIADMDFPSPEPVVQALLKRVEHRIYGYPCETSELKQAVIDWLSNQHQWVVQPDDIMMVPGVICGFNLVSHAVTQPGDEFLLPTPAYPPFFGVQKNAQLEKRGTEMVLGSDNRYTIDFDQFEAAITPKTKVFMLCNPHNPTGRVFTRQELEKMAEICLRHNVLICSDEIHHDIVFSESKHVPIASLSKEVQEKSITILAPSKTFNIAGLTSSIIVCTDPEMRNRLENTKQGLMGWVNIFGQVATTAAYREGKDWLDQMLVYLQKNRDLVYEFVNQELPGIKMTRPEGTYLAWLDCREANLTPNPYQFFLENAKVGLNDGAWFGEGGEGFTRLNFACPRSLLIEGLERMKKALTA